MRAKKVFALLMATAISLSLFGCQNAKNSSSDQSKSSSKSTVMTPYGKYSQTVTFTTGRAISANPNYPSGMSDSNNPYSDAMLNQLNVKMKISWSVSSDQYATKLNLCMASGDMPDIYWVPTYQIYTQLEQANQLADLTQGYNDCASPFIKSVYATYPNDQFANFKKNGEILAMPAGNYGYQYDLLWIRKDWLDKVGLSTPKTVSDIENVAKAFVKQNLGGKDTVGLNAAALPIAYSGNDYGLEPILESYGASPDYFIKNSSGNVVYGSTMPQMQQGLAELANMYKQGLLPKDFATLKAADEDALVSTGKCGMFFAPWWWSYTASNFQKANPSVKWVVEEAPLDSNGNFNYEESGPPTNCEVESKSFAHPELLPKLVTLQFEMERGVNKKLYDTTAPLLKAGADWLAYCPLQWNLDTFTAITDAAKDCKTAVDSGTMPQNLLPFDSSFVQSALDYSKNPTTATFDGYIQYWGRYVASNAMIQNNNKPVYPAFAYTTPTMNQKWANLQSLEQQYELQVITGQKSANDFNNFVSQWNSQGGQQILTEVNQAVANMKS
jgi:putative aldouronate transport system substrate-binding protein